MREELGDLTLMATATLFVLGFLLVTASVVFISRGFFVAGSAVWLLMLVLLFWKSSRPKKLECRCSVPPTGILQDYEDPEEHQARCPIRIAGERVREETRRAIAATPRRPPWDDWAG